MAGIHERLANIYVSEASVSGAVTLTLPTKSAKLIITNDSPVQDLGVTMGQSEFTLKPTETVTVPYRSITIKLSAASSTPYRLWGFY